jgi:cell division protein ZapA
VQELSIKVTIAERVYPLTVKPEEEENIRKAAKQVNDKLKSYEKQFAVRDRQDMLSMCALELASELVQYQQNAATQNDTLTLRLDELKQILHPVSI